MKLREMTRAELTNHHYLVLIESLVKQGIMPGEKGAVTHTYIYHDDCCGIYDGKYCDCNCVVKYNGKRYEWNCDATWRTDRIN